LRLAEINRGLVSEMKQAVVESELIGDVELEFRRAVNRAASGEKQMLLLAEINDRADVERRVVGLADLPRGLVLHLRANQNIRQYLPLQHRADEAPILIARAGINAIAAATVGCP